MSAPALQIEQLTFSYPGQAVRSFPDWQVAAGEHGLLLGASGCGKSTLLHLIAGLLRAHSGRIVINGALLTDLPAAAQDRLRGQHIGLVFQRLHLIPSLGVLQNLLLAQTSAGLVADAASAQKVLASLEIESTALRKPRQLSQGQQQRVAVARAVINRPALILADEPTASLDDASAERVLDLLKTQAESVGAALIVATHDARAKARFSQRLELNG